MRESMRGSIEPEPKSESHSPQQVSAPQTPLNLREFFKREDVALAFMRLMHIPGNHTGQGFRCILRGHTERHPSAVLKKNPQDGIIRYYDYHKRGEDLSYAQAEVYAAHLYKGKIKRITTRPLLATWGIRLLVDLGFLKPLDVKFPPLPPTSHRSYKKVYDGIKLLFGCKWLHTPGASSPLSWKFLAAWCGVSQVTAGNALAFLIQQGIVHKDDPYATKNREMNLFFPGPDPNTIKPLEEISNV